MVLSSKIDKLSMIYVWLAQYKASNVTIGFDLGHDLNLEFSRSNMEFAISQLKIVRLPRNEKQIYRLNYRPESSVFQHDINQVYFSTIFGTIASVWYIAVSKGWIHHNRYGYINS